MTEEECSISGTCQYRSPDETQGDVQVQDTMSDGQTTKDKKGKSLGLKFDPTSPHSPQIIWNNSQRSSPIPRENEDTWVLLPRQTTSSKNDPILYSLSLEGLPQRYGEEITDLSDSPTYAALGERIRKKPVGPRPSKVKGNSIFSREQQPPSRTLRSTLEPEDIAREHPLYHNVSQKADGLYHCPFEDSSNCSHKPEKLKCNYDKFVDSHLKPYRCKVPECQDLRFTSTACLLRHEREAHAMHGHGNKPFCCSYEGCERGVPGNGFPRQWNLRDHMKRVHKDTGSPKRASISPFPGSLKGRKREVTEDSKALIEQYNREYQVLIETVSKLEDPRNPNTPALLHNVKDCIKSMIQATQGINAASGLGYGTSSACGTNT